MVRHEIRNAYGAAGPRLAEHSRRQANPDFGAHGIGQNAGGIPGVHRPALPPGARRLAGAATQVVYVSPLKALSNDIQKNLEEPLREIQQLALERGYLSQEIRTAVRTGDTLPRERAAMLRNPPHILVTTPESLYILLTSRRSREHLQRVETVIVDEIHAVADDKRGAHLALSLERLDALVCGRNRLAPGMFITGLMPPPQRIGLSATQNPIELVADFLTGTGHEKAAIVQVGRKRAMDLAIEVPTDELSSVTSYKMWEEIFDKIAALHRNAPIDAGVCEHAQASGAGCVCTV